MTFGHKPTIDMALSRWRFLETTPACIATFLGWHTLTKRGGALPLFPHQIMVPQCTWISRSLDHFLSDIVQKYHYVNVIHTTVVHTDLNENWSNQSEAFQSGDFSTVVWNTKLKHKLTTIIIFNHCKVWYIINNTGITI